MVLFGINGEPITKPPVILCHRPTCFGMNLYKPKNTKREDADYQQFGIFMLYCPDCDTFQNHAGREDDYKRLSEYRKLMQ